MCQTHAEANPFPRPVRRIKQLVSVLSWHAADDGNSPRFPLILAPVIFMFVMQLGLKARHAEYIIHHAQVAGGSAGEDPRSAPVFPPIDVLQIDALSVIKHNISGTVASWITRFTCGWSTNVWKILWDSDQIHIWEMSIWCLNLHLRDVFLIRRCL